MEGGGLALGSLEEVGSISIGEKRLAGLERGEKEDVAEVVGCSGGKDEDQEEYEEEEEGDGGSVGDNGMEKSMETGEEGAVDVNEVVGGVVIVTPNEPIVVVVVVREEEEEEGEEG